MASAIVKSFKGESRGEVELADEIFGVRPNEHVVYETVKAYMANQRQGTHKTKTRSEVSGGRAKPWRQKGTGRARAGANTSPIWVRGGTAHGPRPRSYRQEIPKKARRLALRSALSDRAKNGKIVVLEDLDLPEAKTKAMAGLLGSLEIAGHSCLVVMREYDQKVDRASRNIPRLSVRVWKELGAYDVVRAEWLVITKDALSAMKEGAAK